MQNPDYEIVSLKTGEKSLRCLRSRETFHPVIGPGVEAQILHVDQQQLLKRSANQASIKNPFVIWDVGLGAAANAITALQTLKVSSHIALHSFDHSLAPLEFTLAHVEDFAYLKGFESILAELVATGFAQVSPGIEWHFHAGDFNNTLDLAPSPHAVLYDPYSPVGNPEMWTLDIFTRLRARLPDNEVCLLTNYTKSTAVRTTLLLAGFAVGYGIGIGQKDQTTIASNRLDALIRPLDQSWLKRVRASHSAAPLRRSPYTTGPITDADYEKLLALPQFRDHI